MIEDAFRLQSVEQTTNDLIDVSQLQEVSLRAALHGPGGVFPNLPPDSGDTILALGFKVIAGPPGQLGRG